MVTERVFTDEELQEMGRRTVDLIRDAIDEGDLERAKKLAGRMQHEFSLMHDMYVDWVAGLMDYIYRSCGEEALCQALRKAIGGQQGPLADVRGVDFKKRVQTTATFMRGHLERMKVEEDDEKVSITMLPCGSGQRLCQKGAYGPPRNLARVAGPHPITWGLSGFPIYCTHEPVLEMLAIEQLGYPLAAGFPAREIAGESCTLCIYKRVEDTPEEVYSRLGKRKPQRE